MIIRRIFPLLLFAGLMVSCSTKPKHVSAAEFQRQWDMRHTQTVHWCSYLGETNGNVYMLRKTIPLVGSMWKDEVLFTEANSLAPVVLEQLREALKLEEGGATSGSQPTTTDSLPERRSVALSNSDSPTVSVVCELRYYLVGHVSSIARTNRLRIMRNDGTNFTCAIAEPLRLLQTVDTNLLWEVGGFIFQIVEPKDFAGQVLTAHFDGPLASGDPFKAFAPGKRYRMDVSQKFIGKTDFGVCY